jgi:hypothetical protein
MGPHQIADLSRRGVGNDALQSLADFEPDLARVGIALTARDQQYDQPGIAPGISYLGASAHLPVAADGAGDVGSIVVAD